MNTISELHCSQCGNKNEENFMKTEGLIDSKHRTTLFHVLIFKCSICGHLEFFDKDFF